MTFHIGFIGGGNITGTHAQAAQGIPGVHVAAFYGQNAVKAQSLSRAYGGTAYTDFEAFLAHQPMNLVIIGSPSGLHAEQGIAAARRGMHVLSEKPLDVTTERVDELIAACEQAGVRLGVIFQDRLKPGICRMKELLDAGALGKPILVDARVKWYRPPDYYAGSRWRGTLALDGGGALMNQGIHTVDLLLWLLGDVRQVQARVATALHSIESEDTAVALLEFTSGAIGVLQAATSAYPGYPRRVELTGSEGTLILDHDRIVAADFRGGATAVAAEEDADLNRSASSPVISDVRGHQRILQDFIDSIRNGKTPCCDGRQGRRSVALAQAIYEASRSGQPVDLGS